MLNNAGFILKQSNFYKMALKFKFKNVEKFTFYSCFWISLQIHNWDKCYHLVFGKAFVYKRQNAIIWLILFMYGSFIVFVHTGNP